ncbi:hypothetical protein CMT41_10625 [Colwellia sp. MT41]|uniref:asparagine synthase-related protein n=1 Tax=Colwellia sp. MT41 TaxID=58049 RepID=UPI000717B5DE|nr:asparagine synthase-related protein [Colwellia sp. MT41]ALO35122.1 hypothetical protein CMT41_10625 [Colwellia sp. MT41]
MPGFVGCYNSKQSLSHISFNKRENLNEHDIENKFLSIKQLTVNKFDKDKVFLDNDLYTIVIEGVILNSLALQDEFKAQNFAETTVNMYEEKGDEFFTEFRGSFSGCLLNKSDNSLIIFTDHIGSKQVFYSYLPSEMFLFGSEIDFLIKVFEEENHSYTLNKNSSYALLTYGFLIENNTMFNEVEKLVAGHYIKITDSKVEVKQYHQIDNTPNKNQSEAEIIEKLDMLFRQAVTRAFEKDREYGYKHLVALSGGLDSRMTNCVAHDLGYGSNIINFTFSESDYLDETIPKKIARDLKHEWIFKALDNGSFLKNIDKITEISAGGALYYGLAHGKSCLDLLNRNCFGLVHSGQLGDVVIGTYFSEKTHKIQFNKSSGAYSTVLKGRFNDQSIPEHYSNEEIFKFYTRGFSGINQGLLISQEFSETYSPFYDLEFMEFCLSIPVELRFGHNIYKKWILMKYPDAAKYVWEKTGSKISEKTVTLFGRALPISKAPKIITNYLLRKLGVSNSSLNTRKHMNPLDYWYNTNQDLKTYLDDYFKINIKLLAFDQELQADCIDLYENHTSIEKNQVLTLLGVVKRYFK